MSPPLLSAGALASARAALGILLTHTCTFTPRADGAEDSEGNTPKVDGTPVTGVPCRWEVQQVTSRDAGGVTIVSTPALAVAPGSPVVAGGKVTDIAGSDSVVLQAGPFFVEDLLDDTAGLGAMLQPTYRLRGAQVAE